LGGRDAQGPKNAALAVQEVFELRRWLLPELLAAATRRAPEKRLGEIAHWINELSGAISLRFRVDEVALAHENLVSCCAQLAKNPAFWALAGVLSEAMARTALWEATLANRDSWREALRELVPLVLARKGVPLRRLLRGRLRALDQQLLATMRAQIPKEEGLPLNLAFDSGFGD
jgi:DNA-binding GntR family transcriptional regulator